MKTEAIRIVIGLVSSILVLVLWPRLTKLNPFFSLLFASLLFSAIVGIPAQEIFPVMQAGFGSLLQQIGIIVALGSVLGMVLEKTGAMEIVSTSLIRTLGESRPALSMVFIGAVVGIPVFCDSGFIILSRLIPSLAAKAATGQGSLVLALSSGLYTTHTLVPPTPGPLSAAATVGLGDQLGMVILVGMLGALPVVLVSYLFAKRFGRNISPSHAIEQVRIIPGEVSPIRAFLPLMLPIILIAFASIGKMSGSENSIIFLLSILGIPAVALLMGVLLALTLIDRRSQPQWPDWITQALKDAGVIILITGAGGAFGAIIKASGIASHISSYASDSHLQGAFFLFFAWLIAAIVKTSQGSSTSSMIITSSLVAPLTSSAGLSSTMDLSILVLAIGGGAMGVSHANDSYFWVVSQFGNITEKESLRWYTPMTLLQSMTALLTAIGLFLIL